MQALTLSICCKKEINPSYFQACWSRLASYYTRECGSQGATLHQLENQKWFVYMRWPSTAIVNQFWLALDGAPCFDSNTPKEAQDAFSAVQSCIEEVSMTQMQVVHDCLLPEKDRETTDLF